MGVFGSFFGSGVHQRRGLGLLQVVLNSCFSGFEQLAVLAMCLGSCSGVPFGGPRHHRQSSGVAVMVPPMMYIMNAVMQLNLATWSDSGSLMPMAFPPSCSMVVQRHMSISEHMKDHASRNCCTLGHRARFS